MREALRAARGLTFVATALAAGCASGPDYRPPEAPVDAAFVQPVAAGEPPSEFWRGFNDPLLDALIADALRANTDVRIAQARLAEARASASEVDTTRLPTIGATAGVARGTDPGDPQGRSASVSVSANWELDFFGRLRSGRESAAAQAEARDAGVDAAQRVVGAEVATSYLALRGAQQRLQVASQALANQRETLRLVELRAEAGRDGPLDVARIRTLVETTAATIPLLEGSIARSVYRLATLTGRTPREAMAALAEPKLLPTLPATDLGALPAGTPQTLLARRPDVRVAERQLAAASANIAAARADLYPRISLVGILGFTSNRIAGLLDSDSRSTSVGASLSWSALNFGRLRSRIGAVEARAEQALRQWEETVALAIEETESALAGYSRSVQQTARLEAAARHAEEAARLARVRHEAGVADLLGVLDAERTVLGARDALVQAQTGTVTALVAVYRALGGGWGAPP